jgi:cytoskeletal protein RodZ
MRDFGGSLRAARERRGVTLRDISKTTKISIPTLEALERDDPSRLPGGIFMRAIVRSYAAEVGLDPDRTLKEFLERFDFDPGPATVQEQSAAERAASVERLRQGHTLLKIVLASLIAAIILYLTLAQRPERSVVEGAKVLRF